MSEQVTVSVRNLVEFILRGGDIDNSKGYKDPDTMKELPRLQLDILTRQASFVKPGGVLIYSTCTLVRAENEGVVEAFLRENPALTTEPLTLPKVFPKNASGMLELIPGEYDTDGFFICRLRRKA